MISVSRLNGKEFFINPDLVEFIEETPDTVITLTTGKKLVVEESAQALIDKIIDFRVKVFVQLPVHVKQQQ